MKLFSLLLLPALFVFSSFASAEMPPTPADREVQIGITGVYAPGGFTASSEAFVVVNGVFQNGCYRWKKADVKHRDDFVHEIRSYAAVSPGMCIMVL
ncbi:MAG: hypothetical protein KF789_15105, partial [Bdellovibrionaceae bacterium]|nr:hypothetical protein [Pseudobdellovibrionaceae bacterium]